MRILLINGPNLNKLGTREPEIYGHDTLADIEARCQALVDELGHELDCRQSNHEGDIVDWIQGDGVDAIVINAGAYTHTSVAIHDALKSYSGYKVELHISNPRAREEFRHTSYLSSAVDAVLAGFGVVGYEIALRQVCQQAK